MKKTNKPKEKSKRTNTSNSLGVRKDKNGVMFTAHFEQAQNVQIAGDFNNWQPQKNPMKKYRKEGIWKARISLSRGSTYRYRYVVDGNWQHDPNNEAVEPNPYNELNSLVTV
jgi:1,4-alpha-glucan branching enzyme